MGVENHGASNSGCNNKDSRPRRPGFSIVPAGWCLRLDKPWNNGMVEKWNIGYLQRMMS
jgi:hypothetical protein